MKITDLTYDGLTVLSNYFSPDRVYIDETTGVISIETLDGKVIPLNLYPKPSNYYESCQTK